VVRLFGFYGIWNVAPDGACLRLHASNEGADDLDLELEICRYQSNGKLADNRRDDVSVSGRGQQDWHVEAWLGAFFDATYSYRFGPREPTIIRACLRERGADASALPLVEAFYYPKDFGLHAQADLGIKAWAEPVSDGCYKLSVLTQQFSRAIAVNVPSFIPEDNYFDVAPGSHRQVLLVPKSNNPPGKGTLRGSVQAFNGRKPVPIVMQGSDETNWNPAL
jgi:beta-mannosidase